MNVGTQFAVSTAVMNKNSQILRPRQKLSLGDLILAVSSCTKSSRETVATVADLLGSGQVRVEDHGRFLRATIDSVLDQNYPGLFYHVQDGGSDDDTVDILKSYGDKISWRSAPDQGQSDAINAGFAALKRGEAIRSVVVF